MSQSASILTTCLNIGAITLVVALVGSVVFCGVAVIGAFWDLW